MTPPHLTRLLFIFVLLVSLSATSRPAQAAAVNVPCSTAALIDSINAANGTAEDDVLNLQAGCTYLLTQSNNTMQGANGLPVIADEATAGKLTLKGSGSAIVRAENRVWLPMLSKAGYSTAAVTGGYNNASLQTSAAGGVSDFRIILVASGGHLTLNAVALRGGHLPDDFGGGIFNSGTLLIENSTVADNTASVGGGIYNMGSLTVINNVISGNTASGSGGGISSGGGAIDISGTLFIGNTAYIGDGLFVAEGTSTVINLTFTGDSAFTCPDFSAPIPAGDVAQLVQAIHCANGKPIDDVITLTAGTYTLSSVDNPDPVMGNNGLPVIQNAAAAGSLTINGSGATIERSDAPGTPDFRHIMVGIGGDLTLNQVTLQNGRLSGFNGGAIEVYFGTLALNNSLVTGNTAAFGGGLAGDGTVTVSNSTFSSNTSIGDGAAINSAGTLTVSGSWITGNTSQALGGGILIPEGTLVLTDTTFSNNTAHAMAGGGGLLIIDATATVSGCTFADNDGYGSGGGLFNSGLATTTVTNSTFTGGTAYNGGAIWNGGTLTLAHSTIYGNSTNGEGGGIYQAGDTPVLHLSHTIVAGNTANRPGPDIYGMVDSWGYNIIGNTSGATITGDITGNRVNAAASPLNLGLLKDNGGPTHTMALLPSSIAIDAGDPFFAGLPIHDQRGAGHLRVMDGNIDIGAYEYDGTFTCPVSPYTVPAGRVDLLIQAIDCANDSPTNDVINLVNSTYTLTSVHNDGYTSGNTGLPIIDVPASAGTLTINGSGAVIERSSALGTPEFRIFMLGGGDLTLNQVTVRNGYLSGDHHNGGAVLNNGGTLGLNNSIVTGNHANMGGAISFAGAAVNITGSSFSSNTSEMDGAVINGFGALSVIESVFTGNEAAGLGGGILVGNGTVTVTDTTFSNNTANADAGGGGLLTLSATAIVDSCTFSGNNVSGAGGGFFNGGSATVINSTFFGNTAADGGAIWNGGTLILSHSTINGNIANGSGGGIYMSGGTASLSHTIVAGNTANPALVGPDVAGAVYSLGYNIIGSTSGATINGDTTGNIVDAAANQLNLSPLQNNGGPTLTMALNGGSVAINAGNPAFSTPPVFDQRGEQRVRGGRIDIGAYESGF